MSEFDGQVPGSGMVPQQESFSPEAASAVPSAGSLLRQAREAAGLHIAALAVALKVPVKKLEALESDRLDLLPDAVFVRALASSVCRTLKMDGGPVLALLPQTGKPRLDYQRTSINTPFRSPSDGPGPSLWTQVSRPAVLAGLLLLLGALVLIFLPALQQQNLTETAAPSGAMPPVLTGPQPDAAGAAVAANVPEGSNPSGSDNPASPLDVPVATVAPAAPLLASGVAAGPVLATPVAGATAVPASPAAPASAVATGLIVFTAKAESWVEVTDAKGVVVLRRTLAAGEAAGASGAVPLAAIVGRADVTQVQVRGRPFDLNAVSKDNVARFEVK